MTGPKTPSMTKIQFAYIARIISEFPDTYDREKIAKQFAYHLADTNPRFDRGRFLAACGVES